MSMVLTSEPLPLVVDTDGAVRVAKTLPRFSVIVSRAVAYGTTGRWSGRTAFPRRSVGTRNNLDIGECRCD
jgi:hypothetical protein